MLNANKIPLPAAPYRYSSVRLLRYWDLKVEYLNQGAREPVSQGARVPGCHTRECALGPVINIPKPY